MPLQNAWKVCGFRWYLQKCSIFISSLNWTLLRIWNIKKILKVRIVWLQTVGKIKLNEFPKIPQKCDAFVKWMEKMEFLRPVHRLLKIIWKFSDLPSSPIIQYTKCLKSKLFRISDTLLKFNFQTVKISDSIWNPNLKSKSNSKFQFQTLLWVRISDTSLLYTVALRPVFRYIIE